MPLLYILMFPVSAVRFSVRGKMSTGRIEETREPDWTLNTTSEIILVVLAFSTFF